METDMRYNSAEYLVDRFLNDIVRLSLVYVKSMDDAQDVAQQVFVTYLQKKPEFNSIEHAKGWLMKVTVNISKNRMRTRHGDVSFDELEGIMSAQDTERDREKNEREEAVLGAVMRLKSIYREVIHLYYYMDYDTNEIAGILRIPPASVRSRLARGREILEKELKGVMDDDGILQKCDGQDSGESAVQSAADGKA